MTEQEAMEIAQRYIGRCLAAGRKNGVEDPDNLHDDHDPNFRLFEMEADREWDDEGYPEGNWEVTIRFPKDFYILNDTDRIEIRVMNDLDSYK